MVINCYKDWKPLYICMYSNVPFCHSKLMSINIHLYLYPGWAKCLFFYYNVGETFISITIWLKLIIYVFEDSKTINMYGALIMIAPTLFLLYTFIRLLNIKRIINIYIEKIKWLFLISNKLCLLFIYYMFCVKLNVLVIFFIMLYVLKSIFHTHVLI